MTRTMYDSINLDAIPLNAEMVAGYVDGDGRQLPADFNRFPNAAHVRITVEPFANGVVTGFPFGDYVTASVIDVETGAFTIADARRFVPKRNDFRPATATVYIQESNLDTLTRYLRGKHYWLWVAWLTSNGQPPTEEDIAALEQRLPPGVRLAAWQYLFGQGYDTSLVVADAWHAQP